MSTESGPNTVGMRGVVVAAAAIAVAASWTELMFEFPSRYFIIEPKAAWFVAGAVVCTAPALAVIRFKWAAAFAIPAAAIFAAWCVALFAARVRAVDWWMPPPPLGYAGAALIGFCAVFPLAVVMGTTLWQIGLGRMRCAALVIAVCLSPYGIIATLNISDYVSLRNALRNAMSLDQPKLVALVERCARVHERQRFRSGHWPREFDALHPQFVTVSPGFADAALYSRGSEYVEVQIKTAGAQTSVFFFTNVDGPQKTVVLWTNAPRIEPEPRIVTLSTSGMGRGPRWIVLPDRVRAEAPSDRGGPVIAETPLQAADREEIEKAAALVRRHIGGRAFEAPVLDGLGLVIHFGSSRAPEPGDIILHNAWVEQAAPLIRTVARFAPASIPLDFEARLKAMFADEPALPIAVRTTTEARDEPPQLPWWCVWRKLAGPQITDPNAITGTTNIPDPYRYIDRDS